MHYPKITGPLLVTYTFAEKLSPIWAKILVNNFSTTASFVQTAVKFYLSVIQDMEGGNISCLEFSWSAACTPSFRSKSINFVSQDNIYFKRKFERETDCKQSLHDGRTLHQDLQWSWVQLLHMPELLFKRPSRSDVQLLVIPVLFCFFNLWCPLRGPCSARPELQEFFFTLPALRVDRATSGSLIKSSPYVLTTCATQTSADYI